MIDKTRMIPRRWKPCLSKKSGDGFASVSGR